MLNRENLKSFYPEIKPNSEHMLKVSELHEIYFASYGNQNGIPVIALHGGPGSGTSPYYAQFFDPNKYHIILADQRGAGLSTPKGEMRDNTTPLLIQDIETIRTYLNIDKWAVFGGSWGSSLALLYAEAHPDRVLGLILRGIFLVRDDDTSAFVREGCPAALMRQKEWEQFKLDTTHLIQEAGLTSLSVDKDKIYHIYYELLQHTNEELRENAAGTLSAWEKFNSYMDLNPEELKWSRSPDGVNMGLTEATYFENHCFVEHNQILNDIDRLKNMPVYIVQGKFDLVCPSYMADELEKALLAINDNKQFIVRHDTIAGHSHKEPGNIDAIILSLDDFALRFKKKQEHTNVTKFGKFAQPTAISETVSLPNQDSSIEIKY